MANMKISIVMAYYNRRDLLIKTLESIYKTAYDNIEIIIIDDASDVSHRVADLPSLFSKSNLKIIQIDKKDKWWVNPCIPNNIGFGLVSGDVIIIQNPECLHVGDIVSYVAENTFINKYIVFGCYAIDDIKTQLINKIDVGFVEDVYEIINPTNDVQLDSCLSMNRWYQHSEFSARGLNFCTAITRQDLEDLGGFDEAYAFGISIDDAEFIRRIRRKGMFVDMVDSPFVIHQYHNYTDYSNKSLVALNTNLFFNTDNINTFRVFNVHTKRLIEKINKTIKV